MTSCHAYSQFVSDDAGRKAKPPAPDAVLKSIREYSPLDDACWSFGEPAPYMHLAQAFAVSKAEQLLLLLLLLHCPCCISKPSMHRAWHTAAAPGCGLVSLQNVHRKCAAAAHSPPAG